MYELIKLVELDVKEWQIIKMPVWTEEKVINAFKWSVEEKLCRANEKVKESVSAKIFYDNDLGNMLKNYCYNSPIKALELAYPNEYARVKNSKL